MSCLESSKSNEMISIESSPAMICCHLCLNVTSSPEILESLEIIPQEKKKQKPKQTENRETSKWSTKFKRLLFLLQLPFEFL